MKKIALLISILVVFIMGACSSNSASNSSSTSSSNSSSKSANSEAQKPLKKVQLLLAATGNTTYYTYIARDKGFFKEEGLDVELVPGKGGTYVVQQIGAGTVDIGLSSVAPILPAWDKGIDIRVVYQTNVTNLFDMFVPKDSKITDIKQLKGKIIGVTDMGSGEVPMVRSVLSGAGLDANKDVTLRAIGSDPATIAAAFDKGEIAAYSAGAHDLVGLYAKGFESKSLMPEIFKSLPSSVIIANGKMVKESPDVIQGITRALARATDFAINNPDGAEELMKKAAPEQYKDEKIGRKFLDTFIGLTTPKDKAKGYGHIYRDSWDQIIEQYSKGDNPVITKKIDLNHYLETSFADKANNFKK